MDIIRGIRKLDKTSKWRTATLGMFDGVHLGHQKVITETVSWAEEKGGESIVITFDRHPESIIRGISPLLITSLEHRLAFLENLGIDKCVILQFTDKLADMPAETFVRRILCEYLQVNAIVWGFDCNFGRGGEGNFEFLRSLSSELNFTVRRVKPVSIGGEIISSTVIREAIISGNLKKAEQMLGRPVAILGTVVRGDGRGTLLGFPTANLDLHHEARPPAGVYETWVKFCHHPDLYTKRYLALTSIGTRPTFHDATALDADGLPNVEVHIINFSGTLYGEDLEVEFVKKIRDEEEFKSAEELIKQIESDLDYVLKNNPQYVKHASLTMGTMEKR